jgi:hypothetical protein
MFSLQVNEFRKLQSSEGLLTHNFRPVQPLSGRPVWFNVADDMSQQSAASDLAISYIPVTLFMLLLTMLQRWSITGCWFWMESWHSLHETVDLMTSLKATEKNQNAHYKCILHNYLVLSIWLLLAL